jgi:hypothetical protein
MAHIVDEPCPRRTRLSVAALGQWGVGRRPDRQRGGFTMLWLIAAIILFVIAIAGGAIVHPILFALAVVALIMAFLHFRRTAY